VRFAGDDVALYGRSGLFDRVLRRRGKPGFAFRDTGEGAEGGLEDVGEEAGALQLHAVAGEAGGDLEDRVPDVVGSVETLDEEGLVLDDRRNGVVAVAKAHVVVVHGEGAAAGAVLVGVVHALVWFGWLALEVFVGLVHDAPPGVNQ
jgi:hypothetical protein